jgi:hypothetical protein
VIGWSTPDAVDAVRSRFGVLRSWSSLARVAVWVMAWCLIASFVVAPLLPRYTDREHEADVPASEVRYVGPIARTDYAGFLPPDHDPDAFTVAWVGGSEVKLREISIPGAFDQRVDTVGGRPLRIDSYNVIAPRIVDAIRAIDTADRAGADAIVVSLNPAWVRSEWPVRGWSNLDVSNLGTLWSHPSSWPWALALTGPDDYGWRLSRAAFPIVEAQTRLNEYARDKVDAIDVLERPEPGSEASDAGEPRLPPGSDLWLVDEYGPGVLADEDARVGSLIGGIGVSQHEARYFASLLLDAAEEADVPVFLYTTPFAPESLADPEFDARAREVEDYWASFLDEVDSGLVELEPRSMSRDYDSAGTFGNNVHMFDPGPFADVLVGRLCAQWAAADPSWECA